MPNPEQIAHSARLVELIVDRIEQAGGVISFHDYMQLCLYAPGLGYYAAGASKFGAEGDFITAPELSPLFGRTLANHADQLFAQGLEPVILEFGAGSGKFSADVIGRLKALGRDLHSYLILEPSPDLQQRQQQYLQQQLSGEDFARIEWLDQLPQGFNGLVLGNEVLDAMPVNVVIKHQDWIELGVGFDGQRLVWREFARDNAATRFIQQIDEDDALPADYCSEVNLNYVPWCNSLAASCEQAAVLLIDYGYEQAQYYHPQRSSGTLMCFYQHRAHPDPLIYPGLQDITAFVDFDAFAEAAIAAGFAINGLTTQAEFLLSNGLLELMQGENLTEIEQMEYAQQVKTLTLPGEMGEKFKVIGMQVGVELEMVGF